MFAYSTLYCVALFNKNKKMSIQSFYSCLTRPAIWHSKRLVIYIPFKLINSLIRPSHNIPATPCQEFVMRVPHVMSCLFLMWIGGTIKSGRVSECGNHPGWFALWWIKRFETQIHTGLVYFSLCLGALGSSSPHVAASAASVWLGRMQQAIRPALMRAFLIQKAWKTYTDGRAGQTLRSHI